MTDDVATAATSRNESESRADSRLKHAKYSHCMNNMEHVFFYFFDAECYNILKPIQRCKF